ncbi:MAG: Gfo/Idh/MocA family oxidoreductase [Phycisphaeraceae bacterium]|nr:MAG: Gfo/Idh/MocA family oxidoreductase [Phycisphaeraceae bacterium]
MCADFDNMGGGGREPLRVGIAGLGRSGWNIHAKTLRSCGDLFTIAAAMDPDRDRREQAKDELSCAVYANYRDLVAHDGLDVLVIASPNHLHCPHALDAIGAGLHVVVEKPFAMSTEEAERMTLAAADAGVVIAPFQNRRYEPHFRKVLEIVRSGALGEVIQIRMCWHRFTRRWDWQAMKQYGGGALFNNGTHLIDQALEFFDEDAEPEVFLDLHRGLSVGDAEEHLKLILKAPGGPTIDIEYTNASAYEQDRWHIMGTAGGLRGTPERLEWKTVDWSRMPERRLVEGPAEGRLYPAEHIAWEEHTWEATPSMPIPYMLFYLELHDAICKGRPMLVSPLSVFRYVHILDRCREQMAAMG